MSATVHSKRGSGVLSPFTPSSRDSRRSSSGGGVAASAANRLRSAHSSSQRSTAASHSTSSTAAATPAHRGLQGVAAEPLLDIDEPAQELSSRGANGGAGGGNSGTAAAMAAAAEVKASSILTVSALEAASVPDLYTGNVSRHVKDEIDELLYQLSVKEKEIRISRGNVQTEMANIKRNIGKMQRDADDLVRQQNNNIASMGKAR